MQQRPSAAYQKLTRLQREVLGVMPPGRVLTAPQVAELLGRPVSPGLRTALVRLVKLGRLERPARARGYSVVRCRGL